MKEGLKILPGFEILSLLQRGSQVKHVPYNHTFDATHTSVNILSFEHVNCAL